MSGTRALFTSIGASVLLVGAAALSLLAVSAVFAFGGWSDPVAESAGQTALVLAANDTAGAGHRTKPYVLPPRSRAQAARPAARTTAPARGSARGADHAAITAASGGRPKASFTPATQPDTTDLAPQSAAPKKSAGDGVRTAGKDLSGRVENTGDALAQIIDPLLPPVTAAAQKVLNAVAELLRRTTAGLGSAVDRVLPAK
jgi:hypothetical protein